MDGGSGRAGWFRSDWLLATALGLASATLRLPRAFASPFWQDEVASARILREPSFAGMLRHVGLTESTPPLWYAAAWALHHLALSIHDTRLLSVAANGALVAGVYRLGIRVLGRRGACTAAVLVAVGGEFSAQGRWLRAYELFALIVVMFALALLAAVQQPTAGRLGAVAATAGMGALTHYFFAFTVLAALAWLQFEPAARAARWRVLGAILGGLLPFTLWAPAFLEQLRHRRYSWIGGFSIGRVVETPLRLFTPLFTGGSAYLAGLVVLLGCAAGATVVWARGAAARLCVVLGLGPLVLAGSVWAAGERVYAIRNMIAIGPFLAITAVVALGSLPRRLGSVAPVAVATLVVAGFAWDQAAASTPRSPMSAAGFPTFRSGCARLDFRSQGSKVRAEYCRARRATDAAVVVLHGCGGFSTFDHRIVTGLPAYGISTLDVDYFGLTPPLGQKGFCGGGGRVGNPFPAWVQTAKDAAVRLRQIPDIRHVGIVGWSLGGGVAVQASIGSRGAHTFEALVGFSTGSFGAEPIAPLLPPTMLLSGGSSDAIPIQETLPLYRALRAAHVPSELYVYPHGSHNWPGKQGTLGIQHAANFLKRYLHPSA